MGVELLLQGLGSAESRSSGSFDLHLFPRLGVSSLSGLSGAWFKGTESGKVDLFAIGKVLCWCVETKKQNNGKPMENQLGESIVLQYSIV